MTLTYTFSPYTMIGPGVVTTGTITLNQPAPTGGVGISLSTSGSAAKVPSTVLLRSDDGGDESVGDDVMRALVIRRPWIDKILDGEKTWEIRGSRTSLQGQIGLIASRSGIIGLAVAVPAERRSSTENRDTGVPGSLAATLIHSAELPHDRCKIVHDRVRQLR